ncbi:MAG: ATP-binding protein [Methyloceanibacter sp.]|jgi:energy-coupling factor transporter ATP-binding protein EcfA2
MGKAVRANFTTEDEFREILRVYITPAEPISNPALLRGREAKLKEIDRQFNNKGAHIFIHGDRGVGKTSLALSAAVVKHPASSEPPYICCDHQASFFDLIRDLANQLLKKSPLIASGTPQHEFSVGVPKVAEYIYKSADGSLSFSDRIRTVNEAVGIVSAAVVKRGRAGRHY